MDSTIFGPGSGDDVVNVLQSQVSVGRRVQGDNEGRYLWFWGVIFGLAGQFDDLVETGHVRGRAVGNRGWISHLKLSQLSQSLTLD